MPLWPFLFNSALEVPASVIRQDKEIKSINFEKESKKNKIIIDYMSAFEEKSFQNGLIIFTYQ